MEIFRVLVFYQETHFCIERHEKYHQEDSKIRDYLSVIYIDLYNVETVFINSSHFRSLFLSNCKSVC